MTVAETLAVACLPGVHAATAPAARAAGTSADFWIHCNFTGLSATIDPIVMPGQHEHRSLSRLLWQQEHQCQFNASAVAKQPANHRLRIRFTVPDQTPCETAPARNGTSRKPLLRRSGSGRGHRLSRSRWLRSPSKPYTPEPDEPDEIAGLSGRQVIA